MRKIWDIPGGIHPPENKTQSTQVSIANIALPSEIILPLNQHIGAAAQPNVHVGDKVLKGQEIASAQGFISAYLHASTSGTITAIEERFIPHSSGMKAPCIVIKPDNLDQWIEKSICEDYTKLDRHTLIENIRRAGITGLGGAGFPTAVKLQPKANQSIDTLILNGTECEPYITADDVLMREHADEIIAGAHLLAFILNNPPNIIIGIEDNKPEAIAAMQAALKAYTAPSSKNNSQIDIVSFPTKYPSGGEKQLIQILTGQEVISGKIPADIGIVVQNIATAQVAYRAIRYGEPLVSRVTTVVGKSLRLQRNINALIGTPISHILKEHGYNEPTNSRLILGGPMMGFAMEHTHIPVIKTTNCILAPSTDEVPANTPAQACIRCGMCEQACPANLLPQQLFWFSQAEDFDQLKSHHLFDCIECGACSYVCPSHIPLVQYYRASKSTIQHLESEKQKSDHARERFEFRQQRIAKAEAEKEAKRLARKKAAEQAKLKLEKNNNTTNVSTATQPGTTQPGTTQPGTTQRTDSTQDPAILVSKLTRSLSSAQSRLSRAKSQLSDAKSTGEAIDPKRIGVLEARIKEAEVKVNDAQAKLDTHASPVISKKASTTDKPSQDITLDTGGLSTASTATQNKIHEKIALSPRDKLQKTINTIEKRLSTAKEKHAEAITNEKPTVDALQQGINKLNDKLHAAQAELAQLEDSPYNTPSPSKTEYNAAESAIAKAQAKANAVAAMSPEEKKQSQRQSLESRLVKAQDRLLKAQNENSEHIEAFQAAVTKLENKLHQN